MEEIELRPKDARLYCVGSVHARNSLYFASNGKFVTTLNKVLLVIFLLLFIHSFQVASDFSVNPTLYIFRAMEIFWMNNKAIIEFGFRMIWRIMQISEGVIRRSRRLRRITPSEICIILHIIRKPNSIIALLFIQNISIALKIYNFF